MEKKKYILSLPLKAWEESTTTEEKIGVGIQKMKKKNKEKKKTSDERTGQRKEAPPVLVPPLIFLKYKDK